MARKHYGPNAQEVNHAILIQGLEENSDGWALSTNSSNLRHILPLCPDGVRICAWCKPYNAMHQNVSPIHAWEPVIVKPARAGRASPWFEGDFIVAMLPAFDNSFNKTPWFSQVHGQKPKKFYMWMFRMLGALPTDEYWDLFPGSGNGDRYWRQFAAQTKVSDYGHP
jgi:hypothetical protein